LIGVQRGDDLGFTVIDLTSVRPCVIAAVEHSLKIERDRRITGQKGDLNRRQWFLEVHWVDVIRFNVVEGMDRDVIVEWSTSGQSRLEWNRRRMVALAKQVDLDEVDFTRQQFLCFRRNSSRPCSSGVLFARLRTSIEVTSRLLSLEPA